MSEDRDTADARLLLHAALDGELDAASLVALERKIAASPQLAAEFESLKALRSVMRQHASRTGAPESLRTRIAAMAPADGSAAAEPAATTVAAPAAVEPASRPAQDWTTAKGLSLLAASMVFGAMLTGFVMTMQAHPDRQLALALVDDHRRALLAREPVDVRSSDQHTVKPWFDTRMAVSPSVPDLKSQGFELVGGRAEVIDGVSLATLVYRLREHVISVTALPLARFRASAGRVDVNGYRARAWSDSVFNYWAIGDLPQVELDTFISAFRASAESGAPSH